MQRAASAIAGRHDFSAFADKRMKEEDSRIVVVERCELVRAGDLILFRIEASHFLWKMVRKLTSFLVEVGRGNERDLTPRLGPRGEPWLPTAPPSGLFLDAIVYEGETFDRPIEPIVPVQALPRVAAQRTGAGQRLIAKAGSAAETEMNEAQLVARVRELFSPPHRR